MTATPPAPGDTPDQRAARLAEGWYNSDDRAPDNPGGLGDDGHVDNLPALLVDVGVVAQAVSGFAVAAAGSATLSSSWAAAAAARVAEAQEAAGHAASAAAVAQGAAGTTLGATGVAGTGDAVTATVGVSLSAYFDLLTVRLVWPAANTTTAPTLGAGALAAKSVRDAAGAPLAAGALGAGALVTATYVAASDHWRVSNTVSAYSFSEVVEISASATLGRSHIGKTLQISGTAPVSLGVAPAAVGAGSFCVVNLSSAYATVSAGGGLINNSTFVSVPPGRGALVISNGVKLLSITTPASASSLYLDPLKKSPNLTLSNGNLTATGTSSSLGMVLAVSQLPPGRWGWGVRLETAGVWAGVATEAAPRSTYVGGGAGSWGYGETGVKSASGTDTPYGAAVQPGAVLVVLAEVVASSSAGKYDAKLWFQVGGVTQGGGDPVAGTSPAFTVTAADPLFPAMSDAVIASVGSATMLFSYQPLPATYATLS